MPTTFNSHVFVEIKLSPAEAALALLAVLVLVPGGLLGPVEQGRVEDAQALRTRARPPGERGDARRGGRGRGGEVELQGLRPPLVEVDGAGHGGLDGLAGDEEAAALG